MTLSAANERKGSKSTVTNPSLYQTTSGALDLQNNQQPAKRSEQTAAGCHTEEQLPFLKKQITDQWGVYSYQATLRAATGVDSAVKAYQKKGAAKRKNTLKACRDGRWSV